MKKISTHFFIALSFLILHSVKSIAQPTIIGTSLANNVYTNYNLNDLGSFRQVKILSTSAGSNRIWDFGVGTAASPDLSTNWRPTNSGLTISGFNAVISPAVSASALYHTSSGGNSGKLPAIVNNTYYTINVQENAAANNYMAVLSTLYNPAVINSVSILGMNSTQSPNPSSPTYVQVSTTSTDGAYYYIRYSTSSSFTTSSVITLSMYGKTGYAFIPAQTAGTTIYYYAFSSNSTLGTINNAVTANGTLAYDMLALSVNNNNGAFYQYTVAAPSPLTGIYTINNSLATGGSNFNSFYDAFSSLNANGVGSGGVTFNVVPGFTETNSNLTLYASGTSSDQIVFQKNGAGTNPLITATTGLNDASDAVIKIVGSDYVTFDGIDLFDPSSNVDSMAVMEAGYELVKFDENDGCQNITIKNSTITLHKNINYAAGFFPIGIYQAHRYPNGASITNLVTTTTGPQSNNKFYSNTIQKVRTGIYLVGYNASTPYFLYDQDNEIGGSTYSTGNIIRNFSDSLYGGYGILVGFENNLNIRFNRINNTSNGGSATPYTSGISYSTSTNSSCTISDNKITLSIARYSSTSDGAIISSVNGTGTMTFQNDTITGCVINPNLSSNDNYNMVSLNAPGKIIFKNCYIGNNTISNVNTFTYFGYVASSELNFKSNFFTSESIGVLDNLNVLSRTGSGSGKINISGNIFSSLSKTSGTINVSNFYLTRLLGSTTGSTTIDSIYNNTISTINLNSVNSFYGINEEGTTNAAKTIYGNSISNITNAVNLFPMYVTSNSGDVNVYNNTISSIAGSLLVYGIYANGSSSAAQFNVYGNDISGITNSGVVITNPSYLTGCNIQYHGNKIYNIQASGAAGQVYGINCVNLQSGSAVYNNLIGDLRAPSSTNTDAVRGIFIASGFVNIYFNSIYLNATGSTSTFGTDGIYYTTTAQLNLRNNIIINLSTPGATGKVNCLRFSSNSLSNYSTASNNNLFYCGTPAANRLIYYDGTNTHQTVSSFQSFVGPTRETLSFSEVPVFLSTIGSNINFLHLDPSTNCKIKGKGNSIPSYSDDFDSNTRSATNPDPGADEFTATTLGEWIGVNSSDWTISANWCSNSVPVSTTDVNLATYAIFQPTSNATAFANNVTINSGTTLTISGGTFNLYGNLTNNGTYTQTAGALKMAGLTGQALPPLTVYNFEINDPNGVTLGGNLTITNKLTLTNGKINTGSNVVIISSDNTSAITGYQDDYTQASFAGSSYVNGTIRRTVSADSSYSFPVGTSTNYELTTLDIHNMIGMNSIDVSFVTSNAGCTSPVPSILDVNGTPISVLQDGGHWIYTPDNLGYVINYDLKEYMRGYTNPAPAPNFYALIKRSNCSSPWYNPGNQDGGMQDEQLNTISVECDSVTTFSEGGIGHGGAALPVQFSSFYAKPIDNSYVSLNWTTSSEFNNNHFEVERSQDGLEFTSIGNVKGAGTSVVMNKYSFNDMNPLRGVSFYKIKQVDNDGKFSYSVIRTVTLNSQKDDISLSPNPASDYLNISSFEEVDIKKLLVTDLTGKILMSIPSIQEASDLAQSIDISKLSAGVYLLHIETETENFNLKFIKQ